MSGLAAYVIALPAGSLIAGGTLHLIGVIGRQPPLTLVGLVAVANALGGSGVLPLSFPQIRWAVPRRWSGYGHTAYSALFGGILGLGVFTTAASFGLCTLLAYGLAAPDMQLVWPVFLAFGISRALPLLYVALAVRQRRLHDSVQGVSALARLALPAEIAVLGAVGLLFLSAHGS